MSDAVENDAVVNRYEQVLNRVRGQGKTWAVIERFASLEDLSSFLTKKKREELLILVGNKNGLIKNYHCQYKDA